MRAWVLFPADSDPGARATLSAAFSSSDCNGFFSSGGDFIDPDPDWQLVVLEPDLFATTNCGRVSFRIDSSPGATVSINYDRVFVPEPRAAAAAAAALAVLAALTRGRAPARPARAPYLRERR